MNMEDFIEWSNLPEQIKQREEQEAIYTRNLVLSKQNQENLLHLGLHGGLFECR